MREIISIYIIMNDKNVYDRYLDLVESLTAEEYDAMMTVQSEYWTQYALGKLPEDTVISDYADMRRVQSLYDAMDEVMSMVQDAEMDEKDLAPELN